MRVLPLIAMVKLVLWPSLVFSQSTSPPTRTGVIFSPSVELELLADVGVRTEGPAPTADGSVYFVDLDLPHGGRIWRWDPVSQKASPFLVPSGIAAGLAVATDGGLLTAEVASGGGRRIGRISLPSGSSATVFDSFDGRPIHGANDLVLDENGRIFFTEYALLGPNDVLHRQGAGIYRVDPDGTAGRIIGDAGIPNGIAISPDQSILYVGSNRFDVLGTKAILAYDLSSEGDASFRSVFVRYPSSDTPDGMAVDRDGNLYVAMFSGAVGVAVYDQTGGWLDFIPTPGPATNVAFGIGEDDRSLFVTAATGLYRLRIAQRGYHPSWVEREQTKTHEHVCDGGPPHAMHSLDLPFS